MGSSASSEKTILNDTVRLVREERYGRSPKKGLDKANLLKDVGIGPTPPEADLRPSQGCLQHPDTSGRAFARSGSTEDDILLRVENNIPLVEHYLLGR